jgi:hypothetical protein
MKVAGGALARTVDFHIDDDILAVHRLDALNHRQR